MGTRKMREQVRCPGCRTHCDSLGTVDVRRPGHGADNTVAVCIGCFNRFVLVLDALGFDPRAVSGTFHGTKREPQYVYHQIAAGQTNSH